MSRENKRCFEKKKKTMPDTAAELKNDKNQNENKTEKEMI